MIKVFVCHFNGVSFMTTRNKNWNGVFFYFLHEFRNKRFESRY